jgi:hypothetical protein
VLRSRCSMLVQSRVAQTSDCEVCGFWNDHITAGGWKEYLIGPAKWPAHCPIRSSKFDAPTADFRIRSLRYSASPSGICGRILLDEANVFELCESDFFLDADCDIHTGWMLSTVGTIAV